MKVNNIIIGKQVSKHLYHFTQDITPEDLLKVIRYLAPKGRELGYLYNKDKIFYTKSDLITRQEFECVYKHIDGNLDYLLDRYSRDDLVNRVGIAIRIITSTTKAEIIQRIIKDKGIIFRFFKKNVVEHHCAKWQEFKREKIFLPATSDKTKLLAFAVSCTCKPLAGKGYLQYWRLGDRYKSFTLDRNFKTEIIDTDLAINLTDSDDIILRNIHEYLARNDSEIEFDLHCESKTINTDDLNIKKADSINYPYSIVALSDHFGLRKGSKFSTFSEGLRKRANQETVEQHLGRKFLIIADHGNIYCGIENTKEFFEKIAWHLKINCIKDRKILCTVAEDETPETVTAVWDVLNESAYSGSFCFIEI